MTTGAGTTVSGGTNGIYARNSGTGALTITANGNVTGTGVNSRGIYAFNSAASTGDLSVTTAAGTTVSGGHDSIFARNYGTGALTITANGNVTNTSRFGIYAKNSAASTGDLSVTTGAGTTVSSLGRGIQALNFGGALTITANGNVTSTNDVGINAGSQGTAVSVTTAAGTTVRGTAGIFAYNSGSGVVTITANGNVTGIGRDGIYASSTGGAIGITVAATSTVTSANAFAIDTVGGPATVTVAGTVAGSMQIGGAGSTLTFLPGAVYKVFVGSTASLATVNGTADLTGAR